MKKLRSNFDLFSLPYFSFFVSFLLWMIPNPFSPDYVVYFHIGLAFGFSIYFSFYLESWYLALRKLNLKPLIALKGLTVIWWLILMGYNVFYFQNLWKDQLTKDILYYFFPCVFIFLVLAELWCEAKISKQLSGNQ